MNNSSTENLAASLTNAFYSAVERRPSFLGKDRRLNEVPQQGLDMRNPAISPDEVLDVYKRFLTLLQEENQR